MRQAFAVSASPTATFRPSINTFSAALTSRSCLTPQPSQVHSRTCSGFRPDPSPQCKQSWDDGNHVLPVRRSQTLHDCTPQPRTQMAGWILGAHTIAIDELADALYTQLPPVRRRGTQPDLTQ